MVVLDLFIPVEKKKFLKDVCTLKMHGNFSGREL